MEYDIEKFFKSVAAHLNRVFGGTALEKWFLHSEGQVGAFYITIILIGLTWVIALSCSSQNHKKPASPKTAQGESDNSEKFQDTPEHRKSVNLQPDPTAHTSTNTKPDTSHPNARLEGFPTRLARALHSSTRTGRVSTPGYQTPFVGMKDARNFSSLAKSAPVSYRTLQRSGMLDSDGTPTKKWTKTRQMPSDQALSSSSSPEAQVAAYEADDTVRKGGRTRLQQELTEEDDDAIFAKY